MPDFKKISFVTLGLLCLFPIVDTAYALLAGIAFSLLFGNPVPRVTATWSKRLLQVSVVGLGFGIGIGQVLLEGRHSLIYTVIGITFTLIVGTLIGRMLNVSPNTSRLISFGTAICGGSAIAAMAPVIKAQDDEIAVSLATVFTLNSIALLLFPFIGTMLHMSQESFGLWAALAIHDTSSVVGAAASFGALSLAIATTVKLTRAMWITPVVLGTSYFNKSGGRITFPLFIIGFVLASVLRSFLPDLHTIWDGLAFGARRLLVGTLFLIGAGLTREVLRRVGFRPMAQGVTLWILVSSVTLAVIIGGII